MKKTTNKKLATIALVLVLTFSAILVALPIVSAHDPPWDIPTYAYIQAYPNPIGQGQTFYILGWLDKYPPTAIGYYGDKWHDMEVTVWKPDGSIEVLGPYDADPVGTVFITYVPDQIGTYQMQLTYPGQTLTGENPHPNPTRGQAYIGDYYEPSTSEKISITVQEDPIQPHATTPLPTDYWERPINQELKGWGAIAGSFLGIKIQNLINYYTTAPETPHIVWTRPITFGGIVGGAFGDTGYYTGQSYEYYWGMRSAGQPIVLMGRLYYNVDQPPRYGYYSIDLRTGEEIWWRNSTGPMQGGTGFTSSGNYPQINFGQLFHYGSPNQHGIIAYLWSTYGTTWQMHDAFTGNIICSIENVPPTGTRFGPSHVVANETGDIQILNVGQNNAWLGLWSSYKSIWYKEAWDSNEYLMWRPNLGQTFDGQNGYMWNVTLPPEVPSTASVAQVDQENRILVFSTGLNALGMGSFPTPGTFTACAVSFKEGEEGQLLWIKNQPWPSGNVTLIHGPGGEGVYTIFGKETIQWYAYDTKTGNLLWGPTDSETALHSYKRYEDWSSIAYGKLISGDFWGGGGTTYCYDVTNGELLWTYETESLGLEGYWPNDIANIGFIADEKIFLYTAEHSPGPNLWPGGKLRCVDIENGNELWKISFWGNQPVVADGYLVDVNSYDNLIYCFGKGQTETTVTGPDTSIPLGEEVLLKGTVTDQSPGAKGTPAIADEDMTEWMEYLYQQKTRPANAEGVEVVLTTLDPNGNTYELDRTTTGLSGTFGCAINPPVPGLYKIIATFEGSNSYYGSYAETYINVEESPSPAQPIEPEPTKPEPVELTKLTEPEPAEPTEAPLFTTTEIAIIAAVVIASVIGIISFWALRKRK